MVALEKVLVSPAPGVVHAHRVVGGDRPVEEPELRFALVALDQLAEDAAVCPELEDARLDFPVVGLARNSVEHQDNSELRVQKSELRIGQSFCILVSAL